MTRLERDVYGAEDRLQNQRDGEDHQSDVAAAFSSEDEEDVPSLLERDVCEAEGRLRDQRDSEGDMGWSNNNAVRDSDVRSPSPFPSLPLANI